MSKKVELYGSFTDAAGHVTNALTVDHGQVFFNADDPEVVRVIAVGADGTEKLYTSEHSNVLNDCLIHAGASYRSLEAV
jgi:hypothetical protein